MTEPRPFSDFRDTGLLVAELHRPLPNIGAAMTWERLRIEAADRLAELDAKVTCTGAGDCRALAHIHGCYADEPCYHRDDLPKCPMCGGTLTVRAATPSPETAGAARCPNCVDGKVSVARMAAVYKLLVDHMHPESPISEEIRSFCRYAVMECNVK